MRSHQTPVGHYPRRAASATVLLVQAPIAEHLRSGVYRELGLAAAQIATRAFGGEERRAAAYGEAICRVEAARALLDELGWEAGCSSVRVDLGKQRQLILKVVRKKLDQALVRVRDAPPKEQADLQRVVLDLGDFALHLQSLHV